MVSVNALGLEDSYHIFMLKEWDRLMSDHTRGRMLQICVF